MDNIKPHPFHMEIQDNCLLVHRKTEKTTSVHPWGFDHRSSSNPVGTVGPCRKTRRPQGGIYLDGSFMKPMIVIPRQSTMIHHSLACQISVVTSAINRMVSLITKFLKNGLKSVLNDLQIKREARGYSGPAVLILDV
jgi:hypothetical protein